MNRLIDRPLIFQLAMAALLGLIFTMPAQADEAAVELAKNQNEEWNRLFNYENSESLAGLYAEDALVSPANSKVIQGRDAIQELFKGYFDHGLRNHRLEVIKAVSKGDWLYEVARWRVTGPPENAVMPLYEGIATIIFRRDENGDWRIHSHTWNQEPDSAG